MCVHCVCVCVFLSVWAAPVLVVFGLASVVGVLLTHMLGGLASL